MKRSILFIVLILLLIIFFVSLKGFLNKYFKNNKEENANIALEYMDTNLSENQYRKILEVNLVSTSASKEILVRYNGKLYGKSYSVIDYAGNNGEIIGVISKITDKDNVPKLDYETNTNELLNAEIYGANERNLIIKYNNEFVMFEKIIEYDELNFEMSIKSNDSMQKTKIIDFESYSLYYYSLDNVTIKLKENKEYDLKYALENKLISIDDIIDKAEADSILEKINAQTYKDGGSRLYEYGTYKILKSYAINRNHDVYIGTPNMNINELDI